MLRVLRAPLRHAGTLGTTCLAAAARGDFKDMWHGAWALKKKNSLVSASGETFDPAAERHV